MSKTAKSPRTSPAKKPPRKKTKKKQDVAIGLSKDQSRRKRDGSKKPYRRA